MLTLNRMLGRVFSKQGMQSTATNEEAVRVVVIYCFPQDTGAFFGRIKTIFCLTNCTECFAAAMPMYSCAVADCKADPRKETKEQP